MHFIVSIEFSIKLINNNVVLCQCGYGLKLVMIFKYKKINHNIKILRSIDDTHTLFEIIIHKPHYSGNVQSIRLK